MSKRKKAARRVKPMRSKEVARPPLWRLIGFFFGLVLLVLGVRMGRILGNTILIVAWFGLSCCCYIGIRHYLWRRGRGALTLAVSLAIGVLLYASLWERSVRVSPIHVDTVSFSGISPDGFAEVKVRLVNELPELEVDIARTVLTFVQRAPAQPMVDQHVIGHVWDSAAETWAATDPAVRRFPKGPIVIWNRSPMPANALDLLRSKRAALYAVGKVPFRTSDGSAGEFEYCFYILDVDRLDLVRSCHPRTGS